MKTGVIIENGMKNKGEIKINGQHGGEKRRQYQPGESSGENVAKMKTSKIIISKAESGEKWRISK